MFYILLYVSLKEAFVLFSWIQGSVLNRRALQFRLEILAKVVAPFCCFLDKEGCSIFFKYFLVFISVFLDT